MSEAPMQSDQIVTLANAVRLLAFHVERVRDEWQYSEELRGIRDDMEDLIYTIKGSEGNKPHLCVPTLDGNAHVIPAEVFNKIVSGEMKITDMEDWEIITRTAFSEWLRGLETA